MPSPARTQKLINEGWKLGLVHPRGGVRRSWAAGGKKQHVMTVVQRFVIRAARTIAQCLLRGNLRPVFGGLPRTVGLPASERCSVVGRLGNGDHRAADPDVTPLAEPLA